MLANSVMLLSPIGKNSMNVFTKLYKKYKIKIFGDAEVNALINALKSGRLVITGHSIQSGYSNYDGTPHIEYTSYITFAIPDYSSDDCYVRVNAGGCLTVYSEGRQATHSKNFTRLFIYAYKNVLECDIPNNVAEQKREDSRFDQLFRDTFGDIKNLNT